MTNDLALPLGQKVTLPGHFDLPVTLEDARILSNGYECRFRLPDGSLEEAVVLHDEVVRNPLKNPCAEPLCIQNVAQKLDHANKEIVEARFSEIPVQAVLKFIQGEHGK